MHFLSNCLDDENIEVEKISKQIVLRLEEISGENIQEYLKNWLNWLVVCVILNNII